jgi:hypothetical protein
MQEDISQVQAPYREIRPIKFKILPNNQLQGDTLFYINLQRYKY